VVTRLEPKLRFDTAEIARLADHIVDFTIGGLQRVSARKA
jgi:hypothetical protein